MARTAKDLIGILSKYPEDMLVFVQDNMANIPRDFVAEYWPGEGYADYVVLKGVPKNSKQKDSYVDDARWEP